MVTERLSVNVTVAEPEIDVSAWLVANRQFVLRIAISGAVLRWKLKHRLSNRIAEGDVGVRAV